MNSTINASIKRRLYIIFIFAFKGPDVHNTRPVLVTFETFKDRETVLKLAKTLSKKAKINVSEDLSKRTREARFVVLKYFYTFCQYHF